ncbi:MAG: DUF3562 domain-containing protein [Burkholderiaceae bacterium]|nr:DUF3562 domain-containing protein [Burkholderiaceae bacterium]
MDLRKQHFVMPDPAIYASPYSNPEERNQHERIIGLLANETSRSVAEVEPLYEDILAHLKDRASVQDYLPILVSRRVKALLS